MVQFKSGEDPLGIAQQPQPVTLLPQRLQRIGDTGIEPDIVRGSDPEELGSLENFKEGMKWVKAGGIAAVYNDNDDFNYTDPATGNQVHIGKNVSLVPSTYEMTFEKDYKKLLFELDLYGEYLDRRE